MTNYSPIKKFYKGTTIFVTGATGFLGKILIEKLLRDTEVDKIFILVREKRGQSSQSRVEDLFTDTIFNTLKSIQSKNVFSKVEGLCGDCALTGLGLSEEDLNKIRANVNIVFHVAATVNFNEPIKQAYQINVKTTEFIIDLAKKIKNLKSLIHVSTAYSNCPYDYIEEKFYEPPIKYTELETILNKMTIDEANDNTDKLLNEWPNTYTYTKALAESVIQLKSDNLTVGVFRPSIIVSTYREPVSGWINNLYGPTGVVSGALAGIIRVMPCSTNNIADIVPVDTCAAGILAAGWDVAENKPKNDITIYNYVSSVENPIRWNELICLSTLNGVNNISRKAFWYPFLNTASNIYYYWALKVALHIFPGTLMDFLCILVGSKPKFLQLYKKIHTFSDALYYFTTKQWHYSNKNVQEMWQRLTITDQQLFPFTISKISWLIFFKIYMKGVKKYILKEDESVAESKRQKIKFKVLHETTKIGTIFIACNLLVLLTSKLCYLFLGIFK